MPGSPGIRASGQKNAPPKRGKVIGIAARQGETPRTEFSDAGGEKKPGRGRDWKHVRPGPCHGTIPPQCLHVRTAGEASAGSSGFYRVRNWSRSTQLRYCNSSVARVGCSTRTPHRGRGVPDTTTRPLSRTSGVMVRRGAPGRADSRMTANRSASGESSPASMLASPRTSAGEDI